MRRLTKREKSQGDLIDDQAIEIVELRRALRRLALVRHVRLAHGGGEVSSGGSCKLCKSEWPVGWPESHTAACLLSTSRL